jgi:hypothetical protein
MSNARHAFIALGGATLLLLGGCNAVLGIDEARPREDGSSQSGRLAVPVKSCNAPRPSCATCATAGDQCGPVLATCLDVRVCREALNQYRGCLGGKCSDDADGTCFAELEASAASDVAQCIKTECATCVGVSPLIDMCDLYCGCMQQECDTVLQSQGNLDWVAGDAASCREACLLMDDLPSTHCRWTHCEIKNLTTSPQHCTHAVSDANCPRAVVVAAQCTDRSLTGWACAADGDCCSKNCGDDHICAD